MAETPQRIVYLLKHAELAVRSCVEVALQPFGLTPNQFLMLMKLQEHDGISAADLARLLGVRPQSIGEIIAPLEAQGLLKREESPLHRRVLRIALTASGRRLCARAMDVARALEAELTVDLSAAELALLQGALAKLLLRAQQHDSHPEVRRAAAQRRPAAREKRRA